MIWNRVKSTSISIFNKTKELSIKAKEKLSDPEFRLQMKENLKSIGTKTKKGFIAIKDSETTKRVSVSLRNIYVDLKKKVTGSKEKPENYEPKEERTKFSENKPQEKEEGFLNIELEENPDHYEL